MVMANCDKRGMVKGAISALAMGATAGAIGGAIVNATHPDYLGITTGDFTVSMMVGNCLAGAMALGGYTIFSDMVENNWGGILFLQAFGGGFSGFLGGAIFGQIHNSNDVGFTIESGLVGAILLTGSMYFGGRVCHDCCLAVELAESNLAERPVRNIVQNNHELGEIKIEDQEIEDKAAVVVESELKLDAENQNQNIDLYNPPNLIYNTGPQVLSSFSQIRGQEQGSVVNPERARRVDSLGYLQ